MLVNSWLKSVFGFRNVFSDRRPRRALARRTWVGQRPEALELRLLLTPTVISVNRSQPSTSSTSASNVVFRVEFSENVRGVDKTDFSVVTTGATGTTTLGNPSPSNSGANSDKVWFVNVSFQPANPPVTSTVTGTVGLNLVNDGSINANGDPLAPGNFTGQVYDVTFEALPHVLSIARTTPTSATTNATSVVYTVTFSEPVHKQPNNDGNVVRASDFTLVKTGSVNNSNIVVTPVTGGSSNPLSTAYTVQVNSITGTGSLRLDLNPPSGTQIVDADGNAITDTNGFTGETYTIAAASAPTITSTNQSTFTVGSAGTFQVTATGVPEPTVNVSGTLPTGVTFNSSTNVLSGTPAAGTAANYLLTFTATNGVGSPATQNFTLTVAAPATQAPAITSADAATFSSGAAGTFTVTATGSPTPTLTQSGTLPAGVTFNPATGVLSGTPTTAGSFPLTFVASNNVGSPAVQSFTLTVAQTTAPAITSASSATFTTGSAGTFTVTATGSPAPTLTQSGTLPAGVTFNSSTGVLSGTPTTNGTFPLTFIASNNVGSPAVQSFTLTVAQTSAATITSANSTTFTTGTAGNFTVTTSGNPTPSLTVSGSLPSGVTFNSSTGVLSGTPATTGTFPLTFVASNNIGSPAIQSFTLTVNAAAVAPPVLAITSAGNPLSQTNLFFASAADGQIYKVKLDANQNVVSSAALVQVGAKGKSLAAVTLPNGSPLVFLIGNDNQVYNAKFDASGNLTTPCALTQGGSILSMTATTDAAGNPMLLVIGSDNQIYFQRFDASGNLTAGYALTSGGAVKSLSASGPTLFAQGLDDQIYQNRFNGTSWGGYNLPSGGAVKTYNFSAASGLLLGIGADDQLYAQRIASDGTSSGWFLTSGGGINGAVQDLYSGKAVAFVLGADNQVYSQRFDAAGNSLGYSATAAGAVKFIYASGLPGSPGVFAIGFDNQVYSLRFDNVTGNVIGGFSSVGTGPVK